MKTISANMSTANTFAVLCGTVTCSVLTCVFFGSLALAQPPDAGRWQLEEVVTKEGKTYRGLIGAEQNGEVEFIEVIRPRGKPMYLVVRPLAADEIVTRKSLPPDAHRKLAERVYAFRFRSRIEAGRMENIELLQREEEDRSYLRYRGPWFTMDSTADAESTRRCIVRSVQIFRAYRQMLPPRIEHDQNEDERRLRVVLFGSMDEYRTFLREHGLQLDNPAVYSPRGNIVVVGGELKRFAQRLAVTRQRHEIIRAQYLKLDSEMDERLAAIRKDLTAAGAPDKQIDDEINARKLQWRQEKAEVEVQLNAADRRNERKFDEVTDEMFRRLYHEAFHAYWQNYLYPDDQFEVPVWLHEGLAQFFQSGRLEADTLRIDAPLPGALKLVQADLKTGHPLPLIDLLLAKRTDFLSREKGDLLYAHAWALVYYLAFEEAVIGTDALHDYIARRDESNQEGGDAKADQDAATREIARFQRLVEQPLLDFEDQFHAATAALKVAP